ncbi:MAG: acetate--CoA ligase family protein [Anaerolineae bacterium]|nr:acetate--CoA ligase family protein [Anaerolineae bacterium]
MRSRLDILLNPLNIAVIGGSEDKSKPGGRIVANILAHHYQGELLIVNPKQSHIQGVRAYPGVADLPAAPELALIAVPAPAVPAAVEALAKRGTPVVVILSAGFGELNAAGKQTEQELARFCTSFNMLMLGPNCSGLMSFAHAAKFAGIIPEMKADGFDFLSGSGASIDFLVEQAVKRGLPFNSFLTVGNSAQSGITDLLALFDENFEAHPSRLKLLYLESIQKPALFLKHARSLAQKGCLMAGIKSGTTQAGSRAAASHTGALASNDTAVQALFDKAGIIRVSSRLELVDVAMILHGLQTKTDGKRVCIITDAGGPGVMLADELNRQGLEVPPLSPETQSLLAEVLPQGGSSLNPVDCLPARNSTLLARVLEIINRHESGRIDYIVFILGDSGLADNAEIYRTLGMAMQNSAIPILPSLCTALSSQAALEAFRQDGFYYFEDEVSLARALGRVVNRPRLSRPVENLPGFNPAALSACLAGLSGVLTPEHTRRVLEAAGVRLPGQVILNNVDEIKNVPFNFPWVMKVVGPLHKSDVGGVRLNIHSIQAALSAWSNLMQIPAASGVLVQPMISGNEVIIGAQREDQFGHLVAFGLGGIYTEVFKDVQFALAPLSLEEAQRMIGSLKSFALIKGVRGQPGMDVDQLADWLLRISLLVQHFPAIREMDLNPVKGTGSDLYAVDARIILD